MAIDAPAPQMPSSPIPLLFRVGFGVEFGKENGIDIEHIGMDRNMVFGEVVVAEAAEARVEDQRFFKSVAHAKDHTAVGR